MLILALLSLVAAPSSPQDARPNVLILVGDDISERDMDALETPAFDALAASGLRFRRAYANPTCSPSRWSLTFGQYHTLGAGPVCDGYSPKEAPSADQPSLPRLFSQAGYRTALFGKWHLGSHPGVQQGEPWEEAPRLHGYETWRAGLPANVNTCGGKHYRDWLRVDDERSAMSTDYVPDAIREAFLTWHAEAEAIERPWFAMVCFQSPHAPLHVAPGAPDTQRNEDGDEQPTRRKKFETQVRYLDETIAQMLAVVDRERTLVVFLADNGSPRGAASGAQDPKKRKMTSYEDGIRVPMVWAGPRVPSGVETGSLVHVADLLPTLAQLVEGQLDTEELDGTSLVPLLASPERAVREYVWCELGPNTTALLGDFAVVTPRYKLRRLGTKPFLFDLELDPQETVNLAGREEHAELQADLEAKLERHLKPEHQVQLRPARERGRKR